MLWWLCFCVRRVPRFLWPVNNIVTINLNLFSCFCRWHFDDFFHSFMMMFRVLCGEWIEPLWDCMRINDVASAYCVVVFFPTLIFGNFVVWHCVCQAVLLCVLSRRLVIWNALSGIDCRDNSLSVQFTEFVMKTIITCCGSKRERVSVCLCVRMCMHSHVHVQNGIET